MNKIDLFGYEIKLLYKKDDSFKTKLGGLISLFFIIFMISIFGYKFFYFIVEYKITSDFT